MGDNLGGTISAVLGCDLDSVISKVRLSERREEKGDWFEGIWIGYCRGWVWEKCFISGVGLIDWRCWRWDGLRQHEGGFCLGGSGTCRAWSGQRWGWVKEEKKREKTHLCGGENGGATCRSVGGPRIGVGVWGGALSPSRWCMGWIWRAWQVEPCGVKNSENALKVNNSCNCFLGLRGSFYSQWKWFSV